MKKLNEQESDQKISSSPVTPKGKAQTPLVQQNIFDYGQSSVSQHVTRSASNMRLSHAEYQAWSAVSSPQLKAVDNISSPSLLLNRKKNKTPVIICTEPSPRKTRSGKILSASPSHDHTKPTSSVPTESNSPHSKYDKSTSSLSMTKKLSSKRHSASPPLGGSQSACSSNMPKPASSNKKGPLIQSSHGNQSISSRMSQNVASSRKQSKRITSFDTDQSDSKYTSSAPFHSKCSLIKKHFKENN